MFAPTRGLAAIAAILVTALSLSGGVAAAATGATKDQAVAMVKKAVTHIKTEGSDQAYSEINDRSGEFVDGDLYIVVYGLDGVVLAHGADASRIGTNQIGDTDPDGKAFVRERVELAKKQPSFWQQYKFKHPVTGKVEPKQMYCERLGETAVCGGVYQF